MRVPFVVFVFLVSSWLLLTGCLCFHTYLTCVLWRSPCHRPASWVAGVRPPRCGSWWL